MSKKNRFSNVLSNPHIANRISERAERIRKQHSAFWMGEDELTELTRRVDEDSIDYLERLRKIQRGVGNMVKIVTGKEIPVIYSSGKESKTDGKRVILSASPDPEKLDVTTGLALHEATHCLLSNRSLDFLPDMFRMFEKMVAGTELVKEAARLGIPLMPPKDSNGQYDMKKTAETGTAIEHVQLTMNILEDLRIDWWTYENAPGYRPYYEACYNEYNYSPKVREAMKSPVFHTNFVENYIMFLLNMTANEYAEVAKNMPGLAEIRKIANITKEGLAARGDKDPGWKVWKPSMAMVQNGETPDYDNFPKLFVDSVKIVTIIYKLCQAVKNPNKPQPQEGGQSGDMQPGDLPNYDKAQMDAVREALDKMKQYVNGQLQKDELPESVQEALDNLEAAKANVVDVEGDFLPKNVKARVVVYRDLNRKIVTSDKFPFRYRYGGSKNPHMVQALSDGIKMGAVLANRLRTLQEDAPLTFNHQEHGRLDKRRVAALGMGSEDVFSVTHIEKKKPANLWIDVDFSGSMVGLKVQKAMTVAVAIAFASAKNRALNVVVAVRDGGRDAAHIAIVYDSRRHTFNKLREILPYMDAAGSTPESLCFEAVKDEMMKTWPGERKFFINLSDGAPGHSFTYKGQHYMYGGAEATNHCRRLMREFKEAEINILSYYIEEGSHYENPTFKQMYGQAASFISPASIVQIANTVNKLLIGDKRKIV